MRLQSVLPLLLLVISVAPACSETAIRRIDEPAPMGDVVCVPKAEDALEFRPETCGEPVLDASGVPIGWLPASEPSSFAFADFDGDGNDDLAVGLPGCWSRVSPGFERTGAVLVCWGQEPDQTGACSTRDWDCELFKDPAGLNDGAEFGAALVAYPLGQAPSHGESAERYQLVVGAPGWTDPVLDSRVGAVRGLLLEPGALRVWWSASTLLSSADPDGQRFGDALAVGELTFSEETPEDSGAELVVGLPGYDWTDGASLVHTDVGAVSVHTGSVSAQVDLLQLPATTTEIGPPFYWSQVGTGLRPMDICSIPSYPPTSCIPPDAGSVCDGARFGSSLAIGRFIENEARGARLDLAVGAPQSEGAAGFSASGHVEILPGESIPFGNLSASTTDPAVGDDCGSSLYLDSARFTSVWDTGLEAVDWDLHDSDYSPEEGDEFGTALFASDLVRTTFADDGLTINDIGEYRDELVIGMPSEDVRDYVYDPSSNTAEWNPTPNKIANAGAVCAVVLPDDDISALVGESEIFDDAPAQGLQRCFSTASTPATSEWGLLRVGDSPEGLRFGTSVVAGRLSAWDPDVQIAAGAPGEVGSSNPLADTGSVIVAHFGQIWNEGLFLASDKPVGSFGLARASVLTLDPTLWGNWVAAPPPASQAPAPGRFGETVGLADLRCGGVADLLVTSPDDRGDSVWDAIVGTEWDAAAALQADWSKIYVVENQSSGPPGDDDDSALGSEDLKLAVVMPDGGSASYFYLWTTTNYTQAVGLDCSSVPEGFGEEVCGEEAIYPSCLSYPMNGTNLPGGAPLPLQVPIPCVGGAGLEVPWSTIEGRRWARVAPPRALLGLGDSLPTELFTVGNFDLLDWIPAQGLDSLDASLHVRKADSSDPTGPVDVCMEIEAAAQVGDPPANVSLPFLLNGHSPVDCSSTSTTNGEGQLRWTLDPIDDITCSRGWSP